MDRIQVENNPALAQVRAGKLGLINDNPYTYTTEEYPLVDNGYDVMIQDLSATPVTKTIGPVRISHRTSSLTEEAGGNSVYGHTDVFYMIIPWDNNDVKQGQELTFDSRIFITGKVRDKTLLGGITHKVCYLEERTEGSL